MDGALIVAAALLGAAAAPHCAAMCSAPCGALTRRSGVAGLGGFLGGRALGYMAAGAAVAAGVSVFGALGQAAPALRAAWGLAHAAAFGLGLWLLAAGRLPQWAATLGRAAPLRAESTDTADSAGWQRVRGPLRAGAAGMAWPLLPCGVLQAALLVAALASSPWQGAAAMGAFAATSSLGLAAFPALWARASAGARAGSGTVRLAGAALVAGSGWALGHGVWERVAALCGA